MDLVSRRQTGSRFEPQVMRSRITYFPEISPWEFDFEIHGSGECSRLFERQSETETE